MADSSKKRAAPHPACEREIAIPACRRSFATTAIVVIVENAADAARFATMRQPEIFIRPFFVGWVEAIAMRSHASRYGVRNATAVRVRLIALISLRRVEITAAAEPPFRRRDVTRVHVRGRAVTELRRCAISEMPLAKSADRRPRHSFFANSGETRPYTRRDMHADLLEEPPAHHAGNAAAAIGRAIARRQTSLQIGRGSPG